MTLFPRGPEPRWREVAGRPTACALHALAALRRELPELRGGRFVPLWCDSPDDPGDDGIFAFAREAADGARAVVVINASDRPGHSGEVAGAETLRPILTVGGGPAAGLAPAGRRLPAPAGSAVVWKQPPA
jgi:hypothetical protein